MPKVARASKGDAHDAVLLATPDRRLSRTLAAELAGLSRWWFLEVQSVAGAHRFLAEQAGPGALAVLDVAFDLADCPHATVDLLHALRRHGWNHVLTIGDGRRLDGISAALGSGAHGYLVAGERIRTQLAGERISSRGIEVVGLAARGYNNREIGGALGISAETVKSQLVRLSRRFGARDRANLVLLFMRAGIIT